MPCSDSSASSSNPVPGDAPARFRAAGLLLLAALGVMPFSSAGASTVAEIQERGKLVVLCWPHQESLFVRRMVRELGQEGLHVFGGIDVDLMRLFVERLGVELEIRPVRPDFGELIPGLVAGQGDVIASSLTVTQARSRKVDFSEPYYTVKKVVITLQSSPIVSLADLAGKVGTVTRGTSHEEHLRALPLPDLEIESTQFMLDNYVAVLEGRADFTLVDSPSVERVLEQYSDLNKGLHVAFTFPEEDAFAFAVRRGSDLRPLLDQFIEEVRTSGELERVVLRHRPADRRE